MSRRIYSTGKSGTGARGKNLKFQPLRRAVKVPVWGDLGIRLGLALGLIMLVVMIHWFDRGGLVDNFDGHVSFSDVVYFTMISVTTTGFGDIAPVTDRARMVEAIIVTPIRFAVFFIFVGTAYNFIIKRSWEKFRMKHIQEQLSDHIVVLGYGVSGSESVNELIERGTEPSEIVVIDPSEERLLEAEKDPAGRLGLLSEAVEGQIATVFRQIAMNRFEHAVLALQRLAGLQAIGDIGEKTMPDRSAIGLALGGRLRLNPAPPPIGNVGPEHRAQHRQVLTGAVHQGQEPGKVFRNDVAEEQPLIPDHLGGIHAQHVKR